MADTIDDNGNITTYQGDNFDYTIDGITVISGHTYKTYFRIYDDKRNTMKEIESTVSNGSSTFSFSASDTNSLTVPKDEEYKVYYFGIKLCDITAGTEDTLFIAGGDFGTLNTITVYPKKVEGTVNNG